MTRARIGPFRRQVVQVARDADLGGVQAGRDQSLVGHRNRAGERAGRCGHADGVRGIGRRLHHPISGNAGGDAEGGNPCVGAADRRDGRSVWGRRRPDTAATGGTECEDYEEREGSGQGFNLRPEDTPP